MSENYTKNLEVKMKDNLEAFKGRARKIRTGRISPSVLDQVQVLYYGRNTPVSQMASISSPQARSLVISPWSSDALKNLEQALAKANLGATPQNDGKVIRLNFPELTKDRREELVKELKKEGEKCRVDLRNSRRIVNEEIKKAVKDKAISEDDSKSFQSEIQKITDSHMKETEEIIKLKEKEILEI